MNKYKRLALAWEEFDPILKDTKGFGYTYAKLEQVIKNTFSILLKNDLLVLQGLETKENNQDYLYTDLVDLVTGEKERLATSYIDMNVDLSKMNKYQVMGSAISYFRRYHLLAVLGLAQEDNDGNFENYKNNKSNQKQLTEKETDTSKIPNSVNIIYDCLLKTCKENGKFGDFGFSEEWKKLEIEKRHELLKFYPKHMDAFKKECLKHAEANKSNSEEQGMASVETISQNGERDSDSNTVK